MKKLAILIICSLVCCVSFAQNRYVNRITGNDAGVCNLPGSPCKTIQYAVNQAVAGDNINIAAGGYFQDVLINKSLNILGAKQGILGYDPSRGSSESGIFGFVTITASNVVIDGMYIFSDSQEALTAAFVSNLVIKNTVFNARNAGAVYFDDISLSNCSNTLIERNRFATGKTGIILIKSNQTTIQRNVLGILPSGSAGDVLSDFGIDIKNNCANVNILENYFKQIQKFALIRIQAANPNGLTGKVTIRNNYLTNNTSGGTIQDSGISIVDGTSPWDASLVEILENYFTNANKCLYAGNQNTIAGGKIYANANYWGTAQSPTRGNSTGEAITGVAQTDVDALLWFYNPVDVSTNLGFQSNKKLSFDPVETGVTLQPAITAMPRPALPLLERWELRPSFLGDVTFVEDVTVSTPMFLEGTYNTFKTNINSGGTLPQVVNIASDSVLFRAFNLNIDDTTPRGVVVEGVEETEILDNGFYNLATANGKMLVVDSKKTAAPFVTNTIKIQNNTFFNSNFPDSGTAISFLNSNKGVSGQPSPEFGTISLTGNTFEEPYQYFLLLDPTVGKEFTFSPDISNNTFAVNGTPNLPSAIPDETGFFILENKLMHKIDVSTVGFLNVKSNHYYVTPQSFYAPFTTTASVQRAVSLATATNVIHISGINYPAPDYPNATTITQPLTFDMEDGVTPNLQSLTMNIGGGGTLDVLGNLGIYNTLTLTNGYIMPDATGNVTFAPNFTTVAGGNNTSYINGTVQIDKTGVSSPTSFIAPIGEGANTYRPFSLSAMSGTDPVFTIKTSTDLTGATKDATFNSFLPKPAGINNRFWNFTLLSGSIGTPGTLVAGYGASDGITAANQNLAAIGYCTTQTGTYTSVTASPGGSAIPDGTITANPTVIGATNFFTLTIQCGGIVPAPTLTIVGATIDICESKDLTLSISSPVAGNTYYWVGTGIAPGYTGTSVTILQADLGAVGNMQVYTAYYDDTFGCTSQNKNITAKVVAQPLATFNYSATGFCKTAPNPTPTTTTAGGTFSASPAGLVFIDTSTGQIDLTASSIGIYTVTYNIAANSTNLCNADSKNTTITIATPATAVISTTSTLVNTNELRYCSGTFTLDASTRADYSYQWQKGGIDIAGETTSSLTTNVAGDYTVVIVNPCGNVTSNIIKLIPITPNVIFAYSKINFCSTDANPSPVTLPTSGGTYTALPSGLSLNASTGQVDLTTSTIGNYTITYTLLGSSQGINCADQQSSVSFNLSTPATPTISTTATVTNTNEINYCSGSVTLSSTTRADYSYQWQKGGIDIAGETSSSLSASAAGDYKVVVTNSCGFVSSNILKIVPVTLSPTFSYIKNNFCSNESNPTPTVASAGGVFSATPSGLSFDVNTGVINLTATTSGAYVVPYNLKHSILL
jgi:hypothetical protein